MHQVQIFGLDWLRGGVLVGKDSLVAADTEEPVGMAREHEKRFSSTPQSELRPDGFRLTDATGRILGIYRITSTAG
jgi:hypothetical protein